MAGETLGDLIATLGSIDDDEIDWQNVRQITVLIQQTFSYEYPGPIAGLRHRLMVVPPDYHDDQRLLTQKIRVSGCDVDTERSYDTFGNVVLDLSLEHVEREVEFTTWAVVEREATVDGTDTPDAISFDQRFAEPSRLTRPDDALRAVADELRDTGLEGLELADAISHRVFEHFEYRWGVTEVSTGAAEAWAAGIGVCQDYAHCMLAICRLCDLPARYVSGHVLGEGGTHAWVEVLVPHPQDAEALRAVPDRPHARPPREPALPHGRGRARLRRRASHLRHLRRSLHRGADHAQARGSDPRRVPAAPTAPPAGTRQDGLRADLLSPRASPRRATAR